MKNQCNRDMPLEMPYRKSSQYTLAICSKRCLQPACKHSRNSSSGSILYSPESSQPVLDNCMKLVLKSKEEIYTIVDEIMQSSNSASVEHIRSPQQEENYPTTIVAVEQQRQSSDLPPSRKKVQFAPSQANCSITVMGLEQFTYEEIEACWYSRNDMKYMRHRCCRKRQTRRPSNNNACIPLLNTVDQRWNA